MKIARRRVPVIDACGAAGLFKTTDFLRPDGAPALCRVIEKAWADVGHPEIRAWPVAVVATKGVVAHQTIKISGLINGAPIEPDAGT